MSSITPVNAVSSLDPSNTLDNNNNQDVVLFSLLNQVQKATERAIARYVPTWQGRVSSPKNPLANEILNSFDKATIVKATETNRTFVHDREDDMDGFRYPADIWIVEITYDLELDQGSIIQSKYFWKCYVESDAKDIYNHFSMQPGDELQVVHVNDPFSWYNGGMEIFLSRQGEEIQDYQSQNYHGRIQSLSYWRGIQL